MQEFIRVREVARVYRSEGGCEILWKLERLREFNENGKGIAIYGYKKGKAVFGNFFLFFF